MPSPCSRWNENYTSLWERIEMKKIKKQKENNDNNNTNLKAHINKQGNSN